MDSLQLGSISSLRLKPSEQAHGLRVLKTLENGGVYHPDLQTAALLHDVGKIHHPLHVWERIFIVLGKYFFPNQIKRWGESQPRGWKRPFVVAVQHPSWGAELAQEVGANPLTIRLIAQHQTDLAAGGVNGFEHHLLTMLQKADNLN